MTKGTKPTARELATVDKFATEAQASRLANVPLMTLRGWLAQKLLTVHDWHGDRLYYLPEVHFVVANPPRRGRPKKERLL